MSVARFFPVFTVAFVVIYAAALYFNLALVTYEPALGQWGWLAATPKAGPGMYWYGWVATSAIGAAIIAALSALAPKQWAARVWSGWAWVVPLAVLAFILFDLRHYFIS